MDHAADTAPAKSPELDEKRDGDVAAELEAAERVYSAICNLDPAAATRACQWATSRHEHKHGANGLWQSGRIGLVASGLAARRPPDP